MRKTLKTVLYGGLEYAGINHLYRKKNHRSLLILTYHSVLPYSENFNSFDYRNCVSVGRFDQQLEFLKKAYRPLRLMEALQRLKTGTLQGGEVVITFDDGFLNNRRYALPLLQKHGLSAVFYISTAFIGRQEMLWTEKVNDIIMNNDLKEITLNLQDTVTFSMNSIPEREDASVKVRTYLKYQPWKVQENVIGQLIKNTKYKPAAIQRDPDRYAFMTWEDVRTIHQAGMEVGSHTHNHLLLNMLSKDESFNELKISRDLIEQNLKDKCPLFSYPNGAVGNFLPHHYRQLSALGFQCAVTQVPGFNSTDTNVFELNRINITGKMDALIFKACLSGSRALLQQ